MKQVKQRVTNGTGTEVGKIERIPLPGGSNGTKKKGYAQALRELKVGECRVLPCNQARATASATYCFGSGKYATRAVDKTHTRVWRLA